MIKDYILFLLYSYLMLVGLFIIYGAFIGVCNKIFYKCIGRPSRAVCIATGLIGTPIHESGHAIFCLIFGHKITEMALYKPKGESLGYVSHSYNPKSFYEQLGNFFIAIGPIILGSIVELLLMLILVNDSFMDFYKNYYKPLITSNIDYSSFFKMLGYFCRCMFTLANLKSFKWWIFILLSLMICLHINLSKEDIKGGLFGLLIVSLSVVILNTILFFVFRPCKGLYIAYSKFGMAIYGAFIISGVLSLVLVIISFIIYIVKIPFIKKESE